MRKPATPTYLDYAPRRSGRPIPRGDACYTGRGYSSRLAARWWEHVARSAVRHIGRLLRVLAKEHAARRQAEARAEVAERRALCLSRRVERMMRAEQAKLIEEQAA